MTRRAAARGPRTVLDSLVAEKIVDASVAKNLRRIASGARPSPKLFFSAAESQLLRGLLNDLMMPARADSRRAWKRDYWVAFHHQYFESFSKQDATARTAKFWKISARHVRGAIARNAKRGNAIPTVMPSSNRDRRWVPATFENARKNLRPARRRK